MFPCESGWLCFSVPKYTTPSFALRALSGPLSPSASISSTLLCNFELPFLIRNESLGGFGRFATRHRCSHFAGTAKSLIWRGMSPSDVVDIANKPLLLWAKVGAKMLFECPTDPATRSLVWPEFKIWLSCSVPGLEVVPALVLLVGEETPFAMIMLLLSRSEPRSVLGSLRCFRHLPSLFDGEKASCVSTSFPESARFGASGSVCCYPFHRVNGRFHLH